MRFALETNVPPALSTGLPWLWGCREKRGRNGDVTQLEDFSVHQLGRQFTFIGMTCIFRVVTISVQ